MVTDRLYFRYPIVFIMGMELLTIHNIIFCYIEPRIELDGAQVKRPMCSSVSTADATKPIQNKHKRSQHFPHTKSRLDFEG